MKNNIFSRKDSKSSHSVRQIVIRPQSSKNINKMVFNDMIDHSKLRPRNTSKLCPNTTHATTRRNILNFLTQDKIFSQSPQNKRTRMNPFIPFRAQSALVMSPITRKPVNNFVNVIVPNQEVDIRIFKPLLEVVLKKYRILCLKGQGAFGQVFKAKCIKTDRIVALKIISDDRSIRYNSVKILREVMITKRLNEAAKGLVPEFIEFLAPQTPSEATNICIVMEHFDIDLERLMKNQTPITEKNIIKIIYQILCSACFLHKQNLVHRDIKSANILIQKNGDATLSDFGLSRSLPKSLQSKDINSIKVRQKVLQNNIQTQRNLISQHLIQTKERRCKQPRKLSVHVCSRWYRAPEVCLVEKCYDQAIDMWAIGVVIYDLLLYAISDDEKFKKERIIFKGASCYPISPAANSQNSRRDVPDSDQLKVIMKGLGKQSEAEDQSFLASEHSKRYISFIQKKLTPVTQDQSLKERIQQLRNSRLPQDLVNLITNLLQFNPYFRMTAEECLQLKVFDSIRDPEKELMLKNLKNIELPMDADSQYDYEEHSYSLSHRDILELLNKEIRHF